MKEGIVLISKNFAGAERAVYNLINNLKNSTHPILIINNEIKGYFDRLNIKIYNLGNLFEKKNIGKLLIFNKASDKMKKIIERENISIINLHLEYSFLIYYLLKKKIEVISTLHGEDLNNLRRFSKIIQNYIVYNTLKKSTKLISVSKGLIENIPRKYKKKTVVIPNGVDSKVFKPLKNIKQKKNVVLFVGRFIDIKGISEIISVAKQLPQYEFWFAGQGPLANLINLSNTKNLGFKSTEELVKLYNQATICIFPSYREAFPLSGLEAMSCGRAVIATPLGFSEYIENGKDGVIIPAKDEVALKNAIINLMTNEKKRKILEKNARNKALQHSWINVAKKYLEVFKEFGKK